MIRTYKGITDREIQYMIIDYCLIKYSDTLDGYYYNLYYNPFTNEIATESHKDLTQYELFIPIDPKYGRMDDIQRKEAINTPMMLDVVNQIRSKISKIQSGYERAEENKKENEETSSTTESSTPNNSSFSQSEIDSLKQDIAKVEKMVATLESALESLTSELTKMKMANDLSAQTLDDIKKKLLD